MEEKKMYPVLEGKVEDVMSCDPICIYESHLQIDATAHDYVTRSLLCHSMIPITRQVRGSTTTRRLLTTA